MPGSAGADVGAAIAAVFRREHGRVVATLVRLLGDVDVTEEADQARHCSCVLRTEDPLDLCGPGSGHSAWNGRASTGP